MCADIVLHNKEIVRVAHPADGFQLKVNSIRMFLVERGAITFFSALVAQFAQICNRITELIASVIAFLIISARIYYVLVFLQISVYVREKLLSKIELRQHRVAVY